MTEDDKYKPIINAGFDVKIYFLFSARK